MDPAKARFLFGEVPGGCDPDDPEDRIELLADRWLADDQDAEDGEDRPAQLRLILAQMVATQIADDDPPEVWATAQRLLGAGLSEDRAMLNLVVTAMSCVTEAAEDDEVFNHDTYRARLATLPIPTAAELADALVAHATAHPGLVIDELEAAVGDQLGFDTDVEPHRTMVDRVVEDLFEDGRLALLAADQVVVPAVVGDGIVLTHRLGDDERASATVDLTVDLAPFSHRREPLVDAAGGRWEPCGHGDHWHAPAGALDRFAPGALLAVRVSGDEVSVEALEAWPPGHPGLVETVRDAYRAELGEAQVPVEVADLVWHLLLERPDTFATPQPPLAEVLDAAGLEERGGRVADDAEVWRNERQVRQVAAVFDRLDDPGRRDRALEVLAAVRETGGASLGGVLATLREPEVLTVVAEVVVGADDAEQLAEAEAFAERLLARARRPAEVGVARWFAAVVAERGAEPFEALRHLEAAMAVDATWPPLVDRLAWYRSDQGDAAAAARLWRRVVPDRDDRDLVAAERFAGPQTAKLGRNDPCWCGSGRKHKLCHLGRPYTPPLPDRVEWLVTKCAAYVDRRGGGVADDLLTLAAHRVVDSDDPEAVAAALADPLLIDVLLHEGGWLERFIEERGPLLPDDERLLVEAWALVDRTVAEVVSVEPGVGLVLRDLRSAEEVVVRERTFSGLASPGTLWCVRVVPDGEGHQLIGGVFAVAPGTEAHVLDLLDRGHPTDLLAWRADLDRPPELRTREGEPLVTCRVELAVPPERVADLRALLDSRYHPEDDGGAGGSSWVELVEIDGDQVLRATVRLGDDRAVVEANSEERAERVLGVLRDAVPGLAVVADEREPLRLSAGARGGVGPNLAADTFLLDAGDGDDAAPARDAVAAWRDRFEERWCDESVPALGGSTPREAAADPVGREGLERLLASFPEPGEGEMGMRPSRLRELLGLG